ncbi:MAG: precorrin-6Y C5,15-methyltransferase (decarboxylating) subunit CbiT [Candidatus Nitrosocaldus sp.]|nr:precorrin-6Y C5,15-methyltransferase (decarboxylating) subunit CbiT [Candidatus Nitrosocaldus sp.]MCS7140837.1 precorrin-6Y C5,15-methyltransferase (decarboxylating) subunit CbiT [Candidatus Nitrosocaldus sp.]MDW7999765.1 precorrin-6Y C5,15-methyltransferase (decarboxylating) subunit CbiT [Candidatus Nitrosocaldus sp.]MDW8274875.1 precorrin-6Y C5,15-methyltransferase (decarboxylating) subunit CbiT [Candidatus Nitrosocaldus sp.]
MSSNLWPYRTPGIPDELFVRDERVPITKEEVRVIALSKARLREGYRVIDVGSGTGSISIEASMQVGSTGMVYAIERDADALRLIRENVKRFGVTNVEIVEGDAMDVLGGMPEADAIFVGGAGGRMYDIVRLACTRLRSKGRIVIDTIMVESMSSALNAINDLGLVGVEVTQIMIAKGRRVSTGTMLISRNPVLVISAERA